MTPLAGTHFSSIFSIRVDFPMGRRMGTDVMTIREVAEYLKLTEKTAYRLAAERKIPGFKVGGAWRFKLSDLEKWIERQSKEQKK